MVFFKAEAAALEEPPQGVETTALALALPIVLGTQFSKQGRKRKTGSAAASKMGGKRPKLLEAERAWLMKRVAEKPDLTLVALLTELRSKDNGKGKRVCLDTLWRFLKGCDLSFKKPFTPPNRIGPTSPDGFTGGANIRPALSLHASSSSTKHGSRQT